MKDSEIDKKNGSAVLFKTLTGFFAILSLTISIPSVCVILFLSVLGTSNSLLPIQAGMTVSLIIVLSNIFIFVGLLKPKALYGTLLCYIVLLMLFNTENWIKDIFSPTPADQIEINGSNQNLQGPDKDGDGIRDDVQEWINQVSNRKTLNFAMRQFAKSVRKVHFNDKSEKELNDLIGEIDDGRGCVRLTLEMSDEYMKKWKSGGDIGRLREEYYDLLEELLEKINNTGPRKMAYKKFQRSIKSGLFDLPQSTFDVCEHAPDRETLLAETDSFSGLYKVIFNKIEKGENTVIWCQSKNQNFTSEEISKRIKYQNKKPIVKKISGSCFEVEFFNSTHFAYVKKVKPDIFYNKGKFYSNLEEFQE